MFRFPVVLLIILAPFCLQGKEQPFVIGRLSCELGNNLFQIATASALAWDNGAEAHFPDLAESVDNNIPANYKHVFFRCSSQKPKGRVQFRWQLPIESNFCYMPIPYQPNMVLEKGTYQSEKFFAHHREQLLELFAPHPDDLAYIYGKYGEILSKPCTVGVQIRWFGRKQDQPWGVYLVQYGSDYFDRAVDYFPEDATFIVSCVNHKFAKENFPHSLKNTIFLVDEPDYIQFYILSLCQHQIISNSTFGWWAAWLNDNPDKVVVTPKEWIDPMWHHATPVKDVWPEGWIQVDAAWTKP